MKIFVKRIPDGPIQCYFSYRDVERGWMCRLLGGVCLQRAESGGCPCLEAPGPAADKVLIDGMEFTMEEFRHIVIKCGVTRKTGGSCRDCPLRDVDGCVSALNKAAFDVLFDVYSESAV